MSLINLDCNHESELHGTYAVFKGPSTFMASIRQKQIAECFFMLIKLTESAGATGTGI